MRKYTKKIVSSFLIFTFVFNILGFTIANAQENSYVPKLIETDLNTNQYVDLEQFFYAIDALPESVINEGPEATSKWISEYTGKTYTINKDKITTQGVVGCTSAVSLAILQNAFAFSKITKVKELIKAGGGVKTFVGNLVPAFQIARGDGYTVNAAIGYAVKQAGKDAGPELISAAIGFFSVGSIYSSCFE